MCTARLGSFTWQSSTKSNLQRQSAFESNVWGWHWHGYVHLRQGTKLNVLSPNNTTPTVLSSAKLYGGV